MDVRNWAITEPLIDTMICTALSVQQGILLHAPLNLQLPQPTACTHVYNGSPLFTNELLEPCLHIYTVQSTFCKQLVLCGICTVMVSH